MLMDLRWVDVDVSKELLLDVVVGVISFEIDKELLKVLVDEVVPEVESSLQ